MRKKKGVHCGDTHEEGDGIVLARKSLPHVGGREFRHHFYGGTRGKGAVEGIDDAVDMVQGEGVQDAVFRTPLPRGL